MVRLWFEPGAPEPSFRARVTYTGDPDEPARSVVLTEPAAVLDTLAAWFETQRSALVPEKPPDPPEAGTDAR